MFKHSKIISSVCVATIVGLGQFAFAEGYTTKNKPSAAQVKKHAFDRSAVINFESTSASLQDAEKTKLRHLINKVGISNVSRVELAVWSDKSFPANGEDLAATDQDLADQRIKNIKEFLKDGLSVSSMRIASYNMTESSNWLARTLRTDDAELKSIFAKEAVAPMARADFNVMVREGAPSKAVVVVVRK